MNACRGVRGATVACANEREAILAATRELLLALIEANNIQEQDVACIFFTTTPDLDAEFPAAAARQLGWTNLALLGAVEMAVPTSVPRCIRVMVLWNTCRATEEIVHCYLGDAARLRPERSHALPALPTEAWREVMN